MGMYKVLYRNTPRGAYTRMGTYKVLSRNFFTPGKHPLEHLVAHIQEGFGYQKLSCPKKFFK